MDPATAVYKLSTGKVTTATLRGTKMLVLPVTNAGNTVKAVSGDVDLKGPLGTRSRDIASQRILPGQTVDLGLPAGQGPRRRGLHGEDRARPGHADRQGHPRRADQEALAPSQLGGERAERRAPVLQRGGRRAMP